MERSINQNLRGFTLVEMVVAIAIMVTLTGVMLANYQGGLRRGNLAGAAQELASNLRRAQAAALSGLSYNEEAVSQYRVYISNGNTYHISCAITPSDIAAGNYRQCRRGKTLEKIDFPPNLQFMDVRWRTRRYEFIEVVFFVPYGDVVIVEPDGDMITGDTLFIDIRDNETRQIKTVSVNTVSGRIDVH